MKQAAAATLQDDVASAFSVQTDRVFSRNNGQVYAIVSKNPDLKIVSDVWFDRFDAQRDFRDVLRHVFDLVSDGGCRYWLADLRFMASDFGDSSSWLADQFMPAIFNAGLEREAVVMPAGALDQEGSDIFGVATMAIASIADGRVRGFTDVQLAKQWLLNGVLPDSNSPGA